MPGAVAHAVAVSRCGELCDARFEQLSRLLLIRLAVALLVTGDVGSASAIRTPPPGRETGTQSLLRVKLGLINTVAEGRIKSLCRVDRRHGPVKGASTQKTRLSILPPLKSVASVWKCAPRTPTHFLSGQVLAPPKDQREHPPKWSVCRASSGTRTARVTKIRWQSRPIDPGPERIPGHRRGERRRARCAKARTL